jgi:NarL family two-component system response regulator LiaR
MEMIPMSEKIKVLVVDDHTVVRKGLCALLSDRKYGIEVIGEAADGQEAVEKARLLKPQVILMDLMMPKMDGLEAVAVIRQENPEARILVLTSHVEDDMLLKAIDAGALGYLMKDSSPDVLVSTINNVHLGGMSLPTDLARKVMLREQEPKTKPQAGLFTERERDVLVCIGKGYSNKQIGDELSVSVTTVRTHVSNLLRKLNLENRTQLALYARQHDIT